TAPAVRHRQYGTGGAAPAVRHRQYGTGVRSRHRLDSATARPTDGRAPRHAPPAVRQAPPSGVRRVT
ncbi:hypothetical protein NGM37_10720, partial [Streptomyces sp. TRM76130]|nr:hypothetical protein [Streptomyces sp. TRM76130]